MSKTWVRVLSRARALRSAAGHLVAVLPDLHVDEVDDDDAPDVAQPQLAGDLLGRLEVVAEDRLFEVRLADVLAGVDVDHGQGLGPLDDERAARGQPDLAVERLVQLLVDVVALEDRQRLDRRVVVLDPLGQLRADRGHVVAHLLVEGPVVDDDAAVLAVELLAQDAHGQVGLAVEEARGVRAGRLGLDHLPLVEQAVDVAAQLVRRGPLGRGAHDQPVAGWADLVDDPAQPAALVVTEALGDPEGARVRAPARRSARAGTPPG